MEWVIQLKNFYCRLNGIRPAVTRLLNKTMANGYRSVTSAEVDISCRLRRDKESGYFFGNTESRLESQLITLEVSSWHCANLKEITINPAFFCVCVFFFNGAAFASDFLSFSLRFPCRFRCRWTGSRRKHESEGVDIKPRALGTAILDVNCVVGSEIVQTSRAATRAYSQLHWGLNSQRSQSPLWTRGGTQFERKSSDR